MLPRLTITRGLPGSGKTTWALAQPACARVSRDDLRLMLYGLPWTGLQELEDEVTEVQLAIISALLQRPQRHVIAHDTNLRPQDVQLLREAAIAAGAEFMIKDFTDVDVEACIKRDADRPEPVGEVVIRSMYERWLA